MLGQKNSRRVTSYTPKSDLRLVASAHILFYRTGQLLHELLNGFVQFNNFLLVVHPDRLGNALGDMILKQNLTGIIDGGPNGGQLNQHLGTVPVAVDHPNDGIQMSSRLGKTVVDRFFVGMDVGDCGIVRVDRAIGMNVGTSPVLFQFVTQSGLLSGLSLKTQG